MKSKVVPPTSSDTAQSIHPTTTMVQQVFLTGAYWLSELPFASEEIQRAANEVPAKPEETKAFALMSLPLEIREEVYRAYFNELETDGTLSDATQLVHVPLARRHVNMGDSRPKLPVLLNVASRQLYEEAIRVYSETTPVIIRRAGDVRFLPGLQHKYPLPTSSLRRIDILQLFGRCTQDLWYFTDHPGAIGRRECSEVLPDLRKLTPNLGHITMDIRQAMLFSKRMWAHLRSTDACRPSPLLESLLQLRNLKCIQVCLPENIYTGGRCQSLLEYVQDMSKGRVLVDEIRTPLWWCELSVSE